MLDVYTDFAENEAAMPVIRGRKSEREKFAGARHSYSIESMMGDRRALQSATSHNLGDNFARAFNIQYLDRNNTLQYCWTTSWGLSTRVVGAIIMVHGDDQGLILPPRLAPIQAVVVPIYKSDEERSQVMGAVERIRAMLGESVRLKVDDREGYTAGWKFNEWELRGVPLRLEVGPKDVAKGQVALARRDVPGREGRSFVPQEGLAGRIRDLLDEVQRSLFERALAFREANTYYPKTYDEFRQAVESGFAWAWWCGDEADELKVQEETKATTRNIPLDQPGGTGACIVCGKPATEMAVWARAY